MAKPASLPEWASDTNFPAGVEPEAGTPTKVAPTSGQETNGWRPDQVPTAQEMNYWQNLVYQWLQYLDGSNFDDDVEITGNLQVDGDTIFVGSLDAQAVSGTDFSVTAGNYKFDDRLWLIAPVELPDHIEGASPTGHTTGKSGVELANDASDHFFRLPFVPAEYRLTKVEVVVDGANTGSMSLMTVDQSDGTWSPVTGATGIGVSGGKHTLIPSTPADNGAYILKCVTAGSGTVMRLVVVKLYADNV